MPSVMAIGECMVELSLLGRRPGRPGLCGRRLQHRRLPAPAGPAGELRDRARRGRSIHRGHPRSDDRRGHRRRTGRAGSGPPAGALRHRARRGGRAAVLLLARTGAGAAALRGQRRRCAGRGRWGGGSHLPLGSHDGGARRGRTGADAGHPGGRGWPRRDRGLRSQLSRPALAVGRHSAGEPRSHRPALSHPLGQRAGPGGALRHPPGAGRRRLGRARGSRWCCATRIARCISMPMGT